MSTHYQTLEVDITAQMSEISASYRKLMRRYHPDLNPGSDEMASKITLAYSVLSDPTKRRQYDRTLPSVTQPLRSEPVIKVSNPDVFVTKPSAGKRGRKRNGLLVNAWSTVGGRVVLSCLATAALVWLSAIIVGLNAAKGITAPGLSGFVIGLFVLTALVAMLNPIRHPWLFISLLFLIFAIPIDQLQGANLLPSLLDGTSEEVSYALIFSFSGALFTKIFLSRLRRINRI